MTRYMAGAAVLLLLAVSVSPFAALAGVQDGTNRAALVVRYEDGAVETRCVAFSEPEITGEELLQRSGLTVVMDYNALAGGAVCSIRNPQRPAPSSRECSVQDCFCRCQGADCRYWAYYHWVDDGWQYSQLGASGYRIKDGSLEGWSWGPGNFSSGTEPPVVEFEDVCAQMPVATSAASQGSGRPESWWGYAGFAVAAVVLLGAGLLVTRRRSR